MPALRTQSVIAVLRYVVDRLSEIFLSRLVSVLAAMCICAFAAVPYNLLAAGPPDMAFGLGVDIPQTWDDNFGVRRPRGEYVFTVEDWDRCWIGVYTTEQYRQGDAKRIGQAPSSLTGLCTTKPFGGEEFKFSQGLYSATIFTHPYLSALIVLAYEHAGTKRYIFVPFELKEHAD